MKRTTPRRYSKPSDDERVIFTKELQDKCLRLDLDNFVFVFIIIGEPKPGKPWNIFPADKSQMLYETETYAKVYISCGENYEKNGLVKRVFLKNDPVHFKLIYGLSDIFSKYQFITILKMENCSLNETALKHIYNMIKTNRNIIDLSLNGNPNDYQNHGIFAAPELRLKYLSLMRCKLSERGTEILCRHLKVNRRILVLNLSGNFIDDKCAKFISDMLKQNIILRALLLSDNWITDDGCFAIMNALQRFALTPEEIMVKRKINLDYFKYKNQLIEQYTITKIKSDYLSTVSSISSQKAMGSGKKVNVSVKSKEKTSAIKPIFQPPKINLNDVHLKSFLDENLPTITHPFIVNTIEEYGDLHCLGNMTLEFLSLSYNKLTSTGYKYITDALNYQLSGELVQTGLMYILLNGNKDLDSLEFLDVGRLIQEQQWKIANMSKLSLILKANMDRSNSKIFM